MTSLTEFIERSNLQTQLLERLNNAARQGKPVEDAKQIINSCMLALVESYVIQAYVDGSVYQGPEELKVAISTIAKSLGPQAQIKIMQFQTEEDALEFDSFKDQIPN